MADQDDDAPIRQRMSILTDHELQRVVTVEADQWQPRAIELAREEILRRGILNVPVPDAQQDEPPVPRSGFITGKRLGFFVFLLLLKMLIHAVK
jgi:hypothetical protein